MQEQIRRIAREADIDLLQGNSLALGFLDTKTKNFARAIIYETLDVIVKSYKGHINPKIAHDAVKKHFDIDPVPIGRCGWCGEPRYFEDEKIKHDKECIYYESDS